MAILLVSSAQRLVHVGLHLAPECAVAGRLVLVLDHHDARARRRCHIVEIVHALLHVAWPAHRVAGATADQETGSAGGAKALFRLIGGGVVNGRRCKSVRPARISGSYAPIASQRGNSHDARRNQSRSGLVRTQMVRVLWLLISGISMFLGRRAFSYS
jgi:hypothetical protein